MTNTLPTIYRCLYEAFGPQHWWPAETPFAVMIGAILTQNTNWGNVERALANLEAAGLMCPEKLAACRKERLAQLIRPSGYFNIKAERLRDFLSWLVPKLTGEVVASLRHMRTPRLRRELLGIRGIGPETADSILIYALGRKVFVVDTYTRRFLERHGLIKRGAGYDEIRLMFQQALPRSRRLYNEYHALIVRLGKEICRPRPRCDQCPLRPLLSGPRLR